MGLEFCGTHEIHNPHEEGSWTAGGEHRQQKQDLERRKGPGIADFPLSLSRHPALHWVQACAVLLLCPEPSVHHTLPLNQPEVP